MLARVLLLSVFCAALGSGESMCPENMLLCTDDVFDGSGQTPTTSLSSFTTSSYQSNISTASFVASSQVIETTVPLSPASSTPGNASSTETASVTPVTNTAGMETETSSLTATMPATVSSSQAIQTTASPTSSTTGKPSAETSSATFFTSTTGMETLASSTATLPDIVSSQAVKSTESLTSSAITNAIMDTTFVAPTATSSINSETREASSMLLEPTVSFAQTTSSSIISEAISMLSSVASTSSTASSIRVPFFTMTSVTMTTTIGESTTSSITSTMTLAVSSSIAISSSAIEGQMTSSSSSLFFTLEPSSAVISVMPTTPTPLVRVTVALTIVLGRPVMANISEVRRGVADLLGVSESDIDMIYLFDGRNQVYPQQKRQAVATFTFDRVDANVRVTSDEKEMVESQLDVIGENNTMIMIGGETVPVTMISETTEGMSSSPPSPTSSSPAISTDISEGGISTPSSPTSSSPTIGTDAPEDGIDTGALAGIVLAVIFTALVITVLVAILVVYFRHRSVTKSYEFDAAEMTYMKNSDVWKSDIPPD